MCDTTAVVLLDGEEEVVMENVEIIRPGDDGVFLKNLFGEEKVFPGRIKEVSLRSGRVILER